MVVALALVTAALFGIGDFLGGLATRRIAVTRVVAGSHVVGAVGALVASLLVAERFVGRDLAVGAAGGAFGMVGVALLYRRLAVGPMSVVAPLTSITSAVVPALWGLGSGERLGAAAWIGLGLGLAAVALVSLAPDPLDRASAPVTTAVIVESLLAGVGFGAMFVLLDATSAESAPWPVVGARVLSSTVLGLGLATGLLGRAPTAAAPVTAGPPEPGALPTALPSNPAPPNPAPPGPGVDGGGTAGRAASAWGDRSSWLLIALVGLADTGANITFLAAVAEGRLTIVSVLAALYPVSTVILARAVLGERLTRPQGLGFASALAASALLAVG